MIEENLEPQVNYESIMKPSQRCQVCLSSDQGGEDYIITCQLCRSAIHQSHYGSELIQPVIPTEWICERCRQILSGKLFSPISCHFCPNIRGIMKQYTYEKHKIWLHPECAAWPYPNIYFSNKKKQHLKKQKLKSDSLLFWVPDYFHNPNPCSICGSLDGLRLKCKYYSCTTSYHTTCAYQIGIVRDLESMRIQNSNSYMPVYCRSHIEQRIKDYRNRSHILSIYGNDLKARHFAKVSTIFQEQLANIDKAVLKYHQEQEMISRLSEMQQKNNLEISISNQMAPNDRQRSFLSNQSGNFLDYLQRNLNQQQQSLKDKPGPNFIYVSLPSEELELITQDKHGKNIELDDDSVSNSQILQPENKSMMQGQEQEQSKIHPEKYIISQDEMLFDHSELFLGSDLGSLEQYYNVPHPE